MFMSTLYVDLVASFFISLMSIVLFCLVLLLVVKSLLVSLLSVIAENRPVLLDVCQCRILLSVLNDIVDLMYCMNRCED